MYSSNHTITLCLFLFGNHRAPDEISWTTEKNINDTAFFEYAIWNFLKLIIFVAKLNCTTPPVHEIIDERRQTCFGRWFLLPGCGPSKSKTFFRATATLNRLIWVQDGTLHHYPRETKQFLMEKLNVYVIGCDTETLRPTHSTNLIPLDIQFSAAVQGEVYA